MTNPFVNSAFEHKTIEGLPLFFYALNLSHKASGDTPYFVFGPDHVIDDLERFLRLHNVKFDSFPSESVSHYEPMQLSFMHSLLNGSHGKIITFKTSAFTSSLPSPKDFNDAIITLQKGQTLSLESLTKNLSDLGYERSTSVYEPGYFSVKGENIELYAFDRKNPIRISVGFNEIESITEIDVASRDAVATVQKLELLPIAATEKTATLLDYLPLLNLDSTTCLLLEPTVISMDIDPLDEGVFSELAGILGNSKGVFTWHESSDSDVDYYSFTADTIPPFFIDPTAFYSFINKHSNSVGFVFTHQREAVSQLLDGEKINYALLSLEEYRDQVSDLQKQLYLVSVQEELPLSFKGFSVPELEVMIVSDRDIFAPKLKKRAKSVDEAFLSELSEGDFVVHIDHGVGKFLGMTTRTVSEITREYFLLEYANGDKIYLPVEYAEKIAKYIGSASPRLNRLHEVSFKQIKGRIKEDARKVAKELLEVQALRNARKGFVFPKSPHEDAFIDGFPFEETDSQVHVWQEITSDLANGLPMDRLVCGDVGFGKTEMAMRTAFRVADLGHQVTVLAPTTILAKQHFESFMERFQDFPEITIQLLSRLQSPSEQKKIISETSEGKISILIGTHRLLSKDVEFKDLGLIIVDEEQRFGVTHKEKLKSLRSKVDILTITATPIPRTLHMGLSGLKQVSTLTTPPPGRMPIKTIVSAYDASIVKQAVTEEAKRGGQVYYLHNRVQTIGAARKKLEALLPDHSFGIVHGQLPPKQIATTMKDFADKKVDVLIASSIIENGIDIPNANTLIIADATRFGLGQLYQLRGRIGRSSRKGFAYFLYPNQKLSEVAKKRLVALKKAQKLGSGFELAMKDLEMRGAGNILGKEQSGKVEAIGLTHYLNLLNEAVRELQTGIVQKEIDVSIELPIDARIPSELVDTESERLALYQSLASIDTIKDLNSKEHELLEGITSQEFSDLFFTLRLKLLSKKADITSIQSKRFLNPDETKYERIVISFDEKADYDIAYSLLQKYPYIEIEEEAIKIDLEALGSNWKTKIQDIVTQFGQ